MKYPGLGVPGWDSPGFWGVRTAAPRLWGVRAVRARFGGVTAVTLGCLGPHLDLRSLLHFNSPPMLQVSSELPQSSGFRAAPQKPLLGVGIFIKKIHAEPSVPPWCPCATLGDTTPMASIADRSLSPQINPSSSKNVLIPAAFSFDLLGVGGPSSGRKG